jgi:UDP-GlcNAc:undecaprenyl-phosphate/decaprenyl-phosphate GlcNAc-1-phosphate transferase
MLYQYFYNMISNNLIFFFVLVVISVLFNKYFLIILKKYNPNLLVDDQFGKPQAFHENPTSVTGGIGVYFSFLIIYLYLVIFKELTYIEHISFCTLFFLLGLIDDLKINLRPKIRLGLMIIFLIFLIDYNNFYIANTGIDFLNQFIKNSPAFSLIFICLCFLFIINGANLIDGYNGLLTIHSLIIFINLFLINYFNNIHDLSLLLFFSTIILIIFLKFNFPNAKIFLGDSGSYFLGTFIAVSVIKTSLANPEISPFYFCVLLFYLFFEVFFSFIRKLLSKNKHPLISDKKHLHMLVYQMLYKKSNSKIKSNYLVSIIINLSYLFLITPAILLMDNGLFCKYYSLLLFLIYIFSYRVLHKKS